MALCLKRTTWNFAAVDPLVKKASRPPPATLLPGISTFERVAMDPTWTFTSVSNQPVPHPCPIRTAMDVSLIDLNYSPPPSIFCCVVFGSSEKIVSVIDFSKDWPVGSSINRSIDWLIVCWLVFFLFDWLLLVDWGIEVRWIDCSIDWLIDWLFHLLPVPTMFKYLCDFYDYFFTATSEKGSSLETGHSISPAPAAAVERTSSTRMYPDLPAAAVVTAGGADIVVRKHTRLASPPSTDDDDAFCDVPEATSPDLRMAAAGISTNAAKPTQQEETLVRDGPASSAKATHETSQRKVRINFPSLFDAVSILFVRRIFLFR